MSKKIIYACPFCGGTELLKAYQFGQGGIIGVQNGWSGQCLYHDICRNCGSVVRSYVKDPERLLKRRDRRK